MTADPPPPPPAPPAPPPPPPPPGPPIRSEAPLVIGGAVVLLVGQLVATVVGITVGLWLVAQDGDEQATVGPGYVELTDEEAAQVVLRATEVGAELDIWWEQQLRAQGVGDRFQPVGDRLTDGDDGVRCDDTVVTAGQDMRDNAWAGLCDEGPVVAFDPATFRQSDVALQVILAHEWAHVAQALVPQLDEIWVDPDAPYAETELQADCYAGAWAATGLDASERAAGVIELRALGDGPEVPSDAPDGHGTPDEREAAFRLGIDEGITACLPAAFDPRPARSP